MDYLQVEIDKIADADKRNDLRFDELLTKADSQRANRRQTKRLFEILEEISQEMNETFATKSEKEAKVRLDFIISKSKNEISKIKINENTMYSFLKSLSNQKVNYSNVMLRVLYDTHKELFLQAFKQNEKVDKIAS